MICSILFLSFSWMFLSNDKVVINFNNKTLSRKNYNPLINYIRKIILKYPKEISFDNIEGIETNRTYNIKGQTKYFLTIYTNDPYKLNIAFFTRENYSTTLADYLRFKMNKHKVSFDD